MKTPRAEITVNGRAVASLFNERLVSVTIIDKEGVSSDSIRCELNDGNPFAAIPEKGDAITARLGFLGKHSVRTAAVSGPAFTVHFDGLA